MEIHAATVDDLEAVERLLIRAFAGHGRSVLGTMPEERQVQVRMDLRRASPDPTVGLLVAIDGQAVAGVVAVETAETAGLPGLTALRALRPLGAIGMARFFAVSVATLYRPAPDEAYLLGMAVAPAYRRRGLATRLIQAAEEQARGRGKTTLSAFVAPNNHASLALFRACGFHEASPQTMPWRRLLPSHVPMMCLRKSVAPLASPPSRAVNQQRRPSLVHKPAARTHEGV